MNNKEKKDLKKIIMNLNSITNSLSIILNTIGNGHIDNEKSSLNKTSVKTALNMLEITKNLGIVIKEFNKIEKKEN